MNTGKKRILLTGGTGFLGSHMARALLEGGNEVVVLKRSFSRMDRLADVQARLRFYDLDRGRLEEIIEECEPDVILHCATDYGRKDSDPLRIIEANLLLPLRLLYLTRRTKGAPMFINTDTILDKRVSAYSLSKQQFKDWLERFADERVCVNVALEHFYGPGDDPTKFVTFVIQALLRAEGHLDLTKGEQKRDFIYISDVVAAFMTLIGKASEWGNGFYQYEVGSNEAVTVRRLVELVKELTGNTETELRFGALPYRPNEVMEVRADTRSLRALGWESRIDLETGLRLTIEEERRRME
ncbi:MAG: NAD-dependent epimerase/dehydratase family protein [bacterium]|nr:NAD-dependent epimerase/dehydratase family protein [bacterium]